MSDLGKALTYLAGEQGTEAHETLRDLLNEADRALEVGFPEEVVMIRSRQLLAVAYAVNQEFQRLRSEITVLSNRLCDLRQEFDIERMRHDKDDCNDSLAD